MDIYAFCIALGLLLAVLGFLFRYRYAPALCGLSAAAFFVAVLAAAGLIHA